MPRLKNRGIIESMFWRPCSECHQGLSDTTFFVILSVIVTLCKMEPSFWLAFPCSLFPSVIPHSIAPAMYLSDYMYNKGLKSTSVASSTVLVSTSCIFVLFLSVLLGLEPFRYGKVLGVVLAVAGTAMTTWQDAVRQDEVDEALDTDTTHKDMLYGDMFSLMAAVGYAAYSVQARILCPADEELYSMTLLLGYVGLITAVPLLPMALYKAFTLEGGMSFYTFCILLLKGLLDFVVTDYLLFRAVMLTNATVANVGLGLTIPLAFAADLIFQGIPFTHLQAGGALTVLAGFVMVNWMSGLDEAEAAAANTGGSQSDGSISTTTSTGKQNNRDGASSKNQQPPMVIV